MSTVIRLFDSREKATAAVEELKRSLSAKYIRVVPADGELPPATTAAAEGSLIKAEVPSTSAKTYADALRKGGTVVAVSPPFGFGATATKVLNKHGGVDLGAPAERYSAAPAGSAAPLSSALGWPVLLDDPTPLSNKFGWSVLSHKQTPDITLSDEPAPLSNRFGWKVLSDKQTPSIELMDEPAPLSKRFGWPVLSDKQTPSIELMDNPAPLSSALGWKLLSNNPAPLSSMFGWKVLLD
ncbi:MAG TPA: hypothetical protein VJY39_04985 [Acidisphaera sp.]|nr:hypothetical protein [Acidisphaera sp.]